MIHETLVNWYFSSDLLAKYGNNFTGSGGIALITKWGKTVSADNVHPEYPRPQMVRDAWQNLNGLWDYSIADKTDDQPTKFDGEILVPFPVESLLSGVQKRLSFGKNLWYKRTFEVAPEWANSRVLLHFGAVDWESTVWINGVEFGTHRGGYDPFSYDITDALKDSSEQEIVVLVWDPSDKAYQPRGKQVEDPKSIWYVPTSGIWQTVWLEIVPQSYIADIKMIPDVDHGVLQLSARIAGNEGNFSLSAQAMDNESVVAEISGSATDTLSLQIDNAKLWSNESPFLYDLSISLLDGDTVVDTVTSYFGMRKVELKPDAAGVLRIFLNNEPIFNYGLLDQGFWPDGLYTPPSDEALRYDIEKTLELGFNTIRKHVKVEPARWYYWTDKLGVLVWQDMPSGDASVRGGEGEITRIEASAKQFELELQAMVDTHFNYPSIIMWVVFNEGWGQYDTVRVTDWIVNYDRSRLINSVTGWNDMGVGHFHDIHSYPGPDIPPESPGRGLVLGEFGGLGLATEGHMWDANFWGYRAYDDVEALTGAYTELIEKLRPLIKDKGMVAAIYTQTTDVETEANGMMTYDREVMKMDVDTVRELSESLYGLEAK